MPESPKWLFVNKYYDSVRNTMYDMSLKHGVEEDDRTKFIFKEEQTSSDKKDSKDEESEELLRRESV
jgi:hypothetical protein